MFFLLFKTSGLILLFHEPSGSPLLRWIRSGFVNDAGVSDYLYLYMEVLVGDLRIRFPFLFGSK
jgi:hypothetical protein